MTSEKVARKNITVHADGVEKRGAQVDGKTYIGEEGPQKTRIADGRIGSRRVNASGLEIGSEVRLTTNHSCFPLASFFET